VSDPRRGRQDLDDGKPWQLEGPRGASAIDVAARTVHCVARNRPSIVIPILAIFALSAPPCSPHA